MSDAPVAADSATKHAYFPTAFCTCSAADAVWAASAAADHATAAELHVPANAASAATDVAAASAAVYGSGLPNAVQAFLKM